VLVCRRSRAAADAGRWRGLSLPGLFAEDGAPSVIARDKRKAFAQGNVSDEAIHSSVIPRRCESIEAGIPGFPDAQLRI
jgi:hypothetical protein